MNQLTVVGKAGERAETVGRDEVGWSTEAKDQPRSRVWWEGLWSTTNTTDPPTLDTGTLATRHQGP